MNNDAATKLQHAALDDKFAEWVRTAVWQFANEYGFEDGVICRKVIAHYWELYYDYVDAQSRNGGSQWGGMTPAETKQAMEDFEKTEEFRNAAEWSKDGSRSLSCGRDLTRKPIDLATLADSARKTLIALYLMALGDSVLLAAEPPDWGAWRDGDKPRMCLGWLVQDYGDPGDERFERLGVVLEKVLTKWKNLETAIRSANDDGKSGVTDNESVEGKGAPSRTPMKPSDISVTANGILVSRLKKGKQVESCSELARLVGCSKSARAVQEAWNLYRSKGGGKIKKPVAVPLHDGHGEGDHGKRTLNRWYA